MTGERMTLHEYSKVAGRSALGNSSILDSLNDNNRRSTRYLTAISNQKDDKIKREEVCTPDTAVN